MNSNYRDKALEIAIDDFDKFCKYAGVNQNQLKVCIERSRGLTLQQITNKLKIPKSTVKDICDRCFSDIELSCKQSKKAENKTSKQA